MVESFKPLPHLQTWFLLFEPLVVQSDAFAEVFCQPPKNRAKGDIIRIFKLGATVRLKAAGYNYRALRTQGIRRLKYNPTAYLWRQLIDHHVPFLKVGVVRDDPLGSSKSENWRHVVNKSSSHLSRTSSNKSPRSSRLGMVARKSFLQFIRFDDLMARSGSVPDPAVALGETSTSKGV